MNMMQIMFTDTIPYCMQCIAYVTLSSSRRLALRTQGHEIDGDAAGAEGKSKQRPIVNAIKKARPDERRPGESGMLYNWGIAMAMTGCLDEGPLDTVKATDTRIANLVESGWREVEVVHGATRTTVGHLDIYGLALVGRLDHAATDGVVVRVETVVTREAVIEKMRDGNDQVCVRVCDTARPETSCVESAVTGVLTPARGGACGLGRGGRLGSRCGLRRCVCRRRRRSRRGILMSRS